MAKLKYPGRTKVSENVNLKIILKKEQQIFQTEHEKAFQSGATTFGTTTLAITTFGIIVKVRNSARHCPVVCTINV